MALCWVAHGHVGGLECQYGVFPALCEGMSVWSVLVTLVPILDPVLTSSAG